METNETIVPVEEVQTAAQPEEQIQPAQQPLIINGDITDDDRNLIYEKLGRPKTAEDYDLSGIAPDNYNQQILEDFKKKAHASGMSNDGVRQLAEWYKEVELKHQEAIAKSKTMQADMHLLELKKEFGSKFDVEVQNAHKALDAYTDKAFRQYMDETGLGNHPDLVKAFAKIGRELAEDRLVQSETAQRLSQDETHLRAESSRLRSNKEFMELYRRGDPAAVRRMNALYGIN